MTGTILTYVRIQGSQSFEELPFNDVDSLILCQLAYLKFDGMVPDVNVNRPSVSLGEVAKHSDVEKLFVDERYEKSNRELFQAMLESRRFGRLRLNAYVNLTEKAWEAQFSAVTFELENGMHYLAFRGTDESIIGWKEDCNMAFMIPVPAQHCALKYLNLVSGRFEGPFYLGGHSKGGNLSIYAAMNGSAEIQDRILKIYNMDGPGFRPETRKNSAYDRIENRIVKLIPHSSFIGMLFEQGTNYRVVESKSLGLFQHNPFTWIVRGDHFVEAKDVYEGRKFLDHAVNEWILTLREEQIRALIDALFAVLEGSGAEDLLAMNVDRKKRMLGMVAAMKELDEETRHAIREMLKTLFEIAGRGALEEIDQRVKKLGEGLKE